MRDHSVKIQLRNRCGKNIFVCERSSPGLGGLELRRFLKTKRDRLEERTEEQSSIHDIPE
eukprot:scaffold6675_cov110-Cylindrotheca_fusiformis.AAC.4